MTPDQKWLLNYSLACASLGLSAAMILFAFASGFPVLLIPFGAAFAFFLYLAWSLEKDLTLKFGGVIWISGNRPPRFAVPD